MKRITIKRIELTTYCNTVEVSDEDAKKLIEHPELMGRRLHELCRSTTENWMDAEDPEWEVELDEEIKVETSVARRPPRRSRRAELPHRAPRKCAQVELRS